MPPMRRVCPAAVTAALSPSSTTAPRARSSSLTSSTRPVQNSWLPVT